MKLHLSASGKFYLTLALALTLLGAAAYFLPFYLFSQVRSSAGRIEKAKSEMALADKRLTGSRVSEELLSSYTARLTQIRNYFFLPDESLRVIETAESIGRASRTETEINVMETKDNVTRFRLSAVGSYPDVTRFVWMVENAPIYFEIESYWLERTALAALGGAANPTGRMPTAASGVRAVLVVKVIGAK